MSHYNGMVANLVHLVEDICVKNSFDQKKVHFMLDFLGRKKDVSFVVLFVDKL